MLTMRQKAFADMYRTGVDPITAAYKAGYTEMKVWEVKRLLKSPAIKNYLEECDFRTKNQEVPDVCENLDLLTNFENVKSMDIDELAGFLSRLVIDANPKLKKRLRKKDSIEFRLAHATAWKQWLKAEVDNE